MLPLPTTEDLRHLSAFDGDSVAAWRLNTELLQLRYGSVGLALLYRGGDATVHLVALSAPDGNVLLDATDPFAELGVAPRLPAVRALLDDQTWRGAPDGLWQASLLGQLLPCETAIVLPLFAEGQAAHALVFALHDQHPLRIADLQLLQVLANLYGAYFSGALDRRDLSERSRLAESEIKDLADVQRQLLPDNLQIRGASYAVHYQPSLTAGGDYYDLVRLSHRVREDYPVDWPDTFGLLIADVSGHGAGAAMEAVQFDAILRTYRGDEGEGPAGALTYANRYYFSRRSRGHFMTALGLLYAPHEGQFRICNAGHLPPIRRRAGRVDRLDIGSDIPIGILREHRYANASVAAEPGDWVVLYTDGIVEARSSAGVEFGIERLMTIIEAGAEHPVVLRDAILGALFAHQEGDVGRDDQTLIVVRIEPPGVDGCLSAA